MANHRVLITGANRGIGLEFCRQYLDDGWQVLACCRNAQHAEVLQDLAIANPNLQIFDLDVADFAQIDALALRLKGQEIDVLINNAGVYPDSSLMHIDDEEWLYAFQINSMAPFRMAKAFAPHIAASRLKKLATLSSKMGSLDDNTSGGSYIYRSSKAAANMVMKNLSVDLRPLDIAVVTLHPGWVLTAMGGPNALIEAHTSVMGMREVIQNLSLSTTGQFIAYDGKAIKW